MVDMGSDTIERIRFYRFSSLALSSEGPPPEGFPAEETYNYTSGADDADMVRNVIYKNWVQQGDSAFLLSFLGGTDNHAGRPATYEDTTYGMQYQGAITGVAASKLTRDDLWSGAWNRHTIAVTTTPDGARIPVLMGVRSGDQNLLMGDLGTNNGTAEAIVIADLSVEKLELVVDGRLALTVNGNCMNQELSLSEGRHFIYVRASFHDATGMRGMAWTSPVYLK